jgi:hypothetical protein
MRLMGWSSKWLRRNRSYSRRDRCALFKGAGGLKLFELQLQLFDLAKHLLALAAEEHALQLLNPSHRRPRLQRLFHNQPPLLRTATTARCRSRPYPIQFKLRCRHTNILKPAPPLLHPANTTRLQRIGKDFEVTGNFAYERWKTPIYLSGKQTVTTTTIQLTWFPERKISF